MVALDLRKQQALDADPKAIQQINFTTNLEREGNTRFSISFLKKQKKLCLNFHKELEKFCRRNIVKRFNFYQYKNDTVQQFK